ncbi:hypothetical protein [Microbulbifer taiwanensis]|uniref:Uncharacterized protein n=1 Tax=Microbulbifer taiwanensis TaxID=986746 RepID=A0ABW1YRR5_9GAMM|nr:hypothetical protein [Microbulbifer taiwanensis]
MKFLGLLIIFLPQIANAQWLYSEKDVFTVCSQPDTSFDCGMYPLEKHGDRVWPDGLLWLSPPNLVEVKNDTSLKSCLGVGGLNLAEEDHDDIALIKGSTFFHLGEQKNSPGWYLLKFDGFLCVGKLSEIIDQIRVDEYNRAKLWVRVTVPDVNGSKFMWLDPYANGIDISVRRR